MSSTATPGGASRVNGTRTTSATLHNQTIELVMELQSICMTLQRLLGTATYQPEWDGTDRRIG